MEDVEVEGEGECAERAKKGKRLYDFRWVTQNERRDCTDKGSSLFLCHHWQR